MNIENVGNYNSWIHEYNQTGGFSAYSIYCPYNDCDFWIPSTFWKVLVDDDSLIYCPKCGRKVNINKDAYRDCE